MNAFEKPQGGTLAPALQRDRGLLRFLTCGSVDDGKSTLIGRMLYDADLIWDDQLETLRTDSARHRRTDTELDFSLLVDGLEAEREQNITIDVAYRYFATARRSFIVADTLGHDQYTRNMATGASNADLALLLVDARAEIQSQTCRHATICSLFGIRHLLLAVNKMDLVDYDRAQFENIVRALADFAAKLKFSSIVAVPVSARHGDNITRPSGKMPWFTGETLLSYLENVEAGSPQELEPFRFALQWVNRANADFRGLSGTVASGRLRPGDPVVVTDGGATSAVARIVTADGDSAEASAGDAVTLTLASEIDASRGDLLTSSRERAQLADQFAAHLLWMDEEPVLPGRSYLMRAGTRWTPCRVSAIKHKLDVHNLDALAARTLHLNEVGFCNFMTAAPVAFDPFDVNRATGAFILVDRFTDRTVAAGIIDFALRRATNVHQEQLGIDKAARAQLKHQNACLVWLTGLPASGKSTIAKQTERQLHARGYHTYMLDGDNLRHGLNSDLGFTDADRAENIRRAGEVAKLFVDAGLIVLCAFISPFRAERQSVCELFQPDEFIEVFVDTLIEACIERDPKGLYAKAKSGAMKNLTGIDSPYERPLEADLVLDTTAHGAEELADRVLQHLRRHGRIA